MSSNTRINIPFRLATNADLARAKANHSQWVETAGLLGDPAAQKTYEAADFPLLVAYTYPSVHGPHLDLIMNLIGWSFLLDDSLDRPGIRQASPAATEHTLNTYRKILDGNRAEPSADPLVTAWKSLLLCVHERSSEDLKARHRRHWEDLFDAFHREAKNNAGGIVPTFPEYLELRRAAGGMEICLDWAEAVGDFEVPSSVHSNPDFLRLREYTDDVVTMTNDIFSVQKEAQAGNTDNAVLVLALQEQCSWERATELTQKLIEQDVAQYQTTEARFLESGCFAQLALHEQSNVHRFLDAMKHWMRGSLEWHRNNPRYK